MKLLKLFSLLCVFLITGCGSIYWSSANALKIRKGMTQQEVIAAVGKPDQRRFRSNMEEWEYNSSDHSTVLVDFINGTVSTLNTFKRPKPIVPDAGVQLPGLRNDPFFTNLYSSMKRSFSTDDMHKALHANLGDAEITCSECAQLLKLFTFDDDKVKAFKYMAPHLSNNEYEVILDCFSFQSGQNAAQNIISKMEVQRRNNSRR